MTRTDEMTWLLNKTSLFTEEEPEEEKEEEETISASQEFVQVQGGSALDIHLHHKHIMLHDTTSHQEHAINITSVPNFGRIWCSSIIIIIILPLYKFVQVIIEGL